MTDPSAGPKVVSLRGGAIRDAPGETDPELVKFIEDLLRRAKEGKMLGLVGAFMMENHELMKYCSTHVFCDTGTQNAMLGLVEIAKIRLANKILEDPE